MYFTSFHAMNIFSQFSNVDASPTNNTHIKTLSVLNLEDDILIFLIKFYVTKTLSHYILLKIIHKITCHNPMKCKNTNFTPSKMAIKYSPCFNHRKNSQHLNVNKLVYNFPTCSHINNCKVGGCHIW